MDCPECGVKKIELADYLGCRKRIAELEKQLAELMKFLQQSYDTIDKLGDLRIQLEQQLADKELTIEGAETVLKDVRNNCQLLVQQEQERIKSIVVKILSQQAEMIVGKGFRNMFLILFREAMDEIIERIESGE